MSDEKTPRTPDGKFTKAPPPLPLKWPVHKNEISPIPRSYRIHRMSAYEWQAFALDPTDPEGERPIGKPNLFDIIAFKVRTFQKMEGQAEFLAKKTKDAIESDRRYDRAKALAIPATN